MPKTLLYARDKFRVWYFIEDMLGSHIAACIYKILNVLPDIIERFNFLVEEFGFQSESKAIMISHV